MKKIIKIEFDDWPERLDVNFIESCLSSECYIEGVKFKATVLANEEISYLKTITEKEL